MISERLQAHIAQNSASSAGNLPSDGTTGVAPDARALLSESQPYHSGFPLKNQQGNERIPEKPAFPRERGQPRKALSF